MANYDSSHVISSNLCWTESEFVVAGYGVEALKVDQRQEVQVVRRGLVMIDER